MSIYTKAGDDGTTGLISAGRVPKDDLRIEAYGTVDELNATLGLARSAGLDRAADEVVHIVQEDLFVVGSALADPRPDGPFHAAVRSDRTSHLEHAIDAMEHELPPLTHFILPGGVAGASVLHLARTVCRRAERGVVRLSLREGEDVPAEIIAYLNRLSDFLFVLARVVNHRAGVHDVIWKGLGKSER